MAYNPQNPNGQATMANSAPVVIASDQASFPVAATLTAETTKVIGTVRNADGAGNLWTSNSTTYTAKFAQDANLLGTLGTAFTTAGFVDVKGADGNVFVRQATASNLNATVVGTGTFVVQATLAAETTKVIGTVRVLGNAGAIVDGVNTAATAPANGVLGLGIYNSTEPSPTTGQSVGIQLDAKGRQRQVLMDAAGNTRGVNVTASNAALVDISASGANSTAGLISVKIDQTTPGTTNAVTASSATVPVSTMNSASANTGVNSAMAAVFDDASPTAITENNFGFVRMSANRNQYMTLRDAAGNERGLNVAATGNISVDTVTTVTTVSTVSSVTAVGTITPGTAATSLGKAEDAPHNTGDVGVAVWGVANEAQTTLAADGDYIAQATDTKGNALVTGNIASGSADAGRPVKVGAVYNSTLPTFTNAQRGDLQIGTRGSLNTTLFGADSATAINASISNPSSSANGLTVRTAGDGLVSTANSTSTPLAASASFTGTSEDVSQYSSVVLTILTDQLSGTDGVQVQQSSNGTNWDITDTYSYIQSFQGKTYSVAVVANFLRVVYTNGPLAQSVFRLQTVYHKSQKKSSTIRPTDSRSVENDMEEVASYISGYDPANKQFNLLRSSVANGLQVDVTRMPAINANVEDKLDQLLLYMPNMVRQLDSYGREKIAPPPDTYTYNVTLTATTSETTLIPAIPGVKIVLVGLVIANTSASTFTEITVRDSTGAVDAGSIQSFTSVGGTIHSGIMLGTQRIPQKMANQNWTIQCGTSTTSIKATAYYQITV